MLKVANKLPLVALLVPILFMVLVSHDTTFFEPDQ